MGLGQGRIPGHSGTDFKHRKAYYKRVKSMMVGKKMKVATNINIPQYSFQELQKGRTQHQQANFKKMLRICIPWTIFLLSFIYYVYNNMQG